MVGAEMTTHIRGPNRRAGERPPTVSLCAAERAIPGAGRRRLQSVRYVALRRRRHARMRLEAAS